MRQKQLLVCDLDNTLYDWESYFVPAFYAMVKAASEIMSCTQEVLLDDMKAVHIRYDDAEHPFALLETNAVKTFYKNRSINYVLVDLEPAFHEFNSIRKSHLHLHEGVLETLQFLRSYNVRLIAHTESRLYGALDRLNRLRIYDYFSKIYCRERSKTDFPNELKNRSFKDISFDKINELSYHQRKPNPEVLLEICTLEKVHPADAAYVGDSMARDILMAKSAGVFAIWAAYGVHTDRSRFEALVRVSHWTDEEVMKEKHYREQAAYIKPDFIAQKSFKEVIRAIGLHAA